jgi:uncharacterized protein (TIGR03437 family)
MRQVLLILLPLLALAQDDSTILSLPLPPDRAAALERFLEAQLTPGSPHYRQWLSPEQFAERFGPTPDSLARVQSSLRAQGFRVTAVSASRSWLTIEGPLAKLKPSRDYLALRSPLPAPQQDFLPGSPDGNRSITPGDVAVLYNAADLLRSGTDGSGVKIVIPGAADLDPADLNAFRARFNLPAVRLTKILVGAAPAPNESALLEANLNLQWAGALARNAELVYVYAADPRAALLHAIDRNLGQVIAYTYAQCEAQAGPVSQLLRNAVLQANAQGVTLVASSGDSGAAACDSSTDPLATKGLAVHLPASIPEVTAVGGTLLAPGGPPNWRSAPDFTGVSALGPVPESAWNDSSTRNNLASSGGGQSAIFARPAWQTGPGIFAGPRRLVPDLALAASSVSNAYVFRHHGAWRTVGGTSASAPVFASILGLLNHYLVRTGNLPAAGLGNINPALYRLWQSVPTVFRDVTQGSNQVPCQAASPDCTNGRVGFLAGPGYDQVSGLGAIDANALISRWDISPALPTTVTLIPSNLNPNFNDVVPVEVIVRTSSAFTPSGAVSFLRVTPSEPVLIGAANLTGSGGAGTATFQLQAGLLAPGRNTVIAVYPGSPLVNGSSSTATFTVNLPSQTSAVQVSTTPREVAEESPTPDGNRWNFRLTLTEVGGTPTQVNGLLVDNQDLSGQIRTLFGNNFVPASGVISANIGLRNIQAPYDLRVVVSGLDTGGLRWTRDIVVPLLPRRQATFISSGGLVNGASFRPTLAPGMLTSAFGSLLAASTAQATALPLPYQIGGISLTVNGVAAPLYFTSAGQLNFQIPYETQPGLATLRLQVDLPNAQREVFTQSFNVVPAAPGIFAGPNNTLVPFASAKRGEPTLLFLTGDGALSPALPTGATPAPTTPLDQLPKPRLPLAVTVAGLPAELLFVGVPPGLTGTTQVTVLVPPHTPTGDQNVVVTLGNIPSPPVRLRVE